MSIDEEIAASVEARRDLGASYDDAIAAGLVERIGAEVDRRVDERISQNQAAPAYSQNARRRPAGHPGGPVSWQQVILAAGSMLIGAITTGSIAGHGTGTWAILVVWLAIVAINMAFFRAGRRS